MTSVAHEEVAELVIMISVIWIPECFCLLFLMRRRIFGTIYYTPSLYTTLLHYILHFSDSDRVEIEKYDKQL